MKEESKELLDSKETLRELNKRIDEVERQNRNLWAAIIVVVIIEFLLRSGI